MEQNQNARPPYDTKVQAEQEDFVRDQFVTVFLQQNKRAQAGLLLCGVLIFSLLAYRVPGPIPYIWLASIVLISGVRFSQTDRFVRAGHSATSKISGLLLLNGIFLVLPVFAFNQLSDVERAIVSIILMATATASVATSNGYKGIFLWFAAPLLLPLSLAWILAISRDDSEWAVRGLGGLITLYLLFLAGLGRDVFRQFDASCRIRFSELALNGRLVAALDDARQASQAKTRFLAAASHDLRQPLHTIGFLVAAMGLRQLDERSQEIVALLGVVSQSLSGQLDGLLDVSKLDAGVVNPDWQVHRMDQIVLCHVAAMTSNAHGKGLYINAHCPEPALVLTDIDLIRRVLGNLTSNAMKFTESGGVDVFVKKEAEQVILEVVDTGVGIPPDQQGLIFQEFYQIGNSERDRANGLGLGLAIVQRLCTLLKAELTLESSPGHGSRFMVRLPLAKEPHASNHEQASSRVTSRPGLPSLSVLVVDDEGDVRQGMRLLLEELGCRTLLADSTEQAIEQAQTNVVDMLISDLRLRKQETGFEVVRKIRDIHPDVYAVLISGDTAPDRLHQAQAAGVPLLHKPVALAELRLHIHNARPSQ